MITHHELVKLICYDPITGSLHKRGSDLGRLKPARRCRQVIHLGGKQYLASRLAWFYMTGQWPKGLIDHRNRNPHDNSWDNLRESTSSENNANKPLPLSNTSGFKGVCRRKNRNKSYQAVIKLESRQKSLGYYYTPEEAAAAYNRAALSCFGEFAVLNQL